MVNQKIRELNTFVEKLGISEEEVAEWFYSQPITLIKTALPLVYKEGNNLYTKIGLSFEHMHKLWGVQILPRVFMSLSIRDDENQPFGREEAKAFAESVFMDDSEGSLPSLEALKAFNNKAVYEAFRSTIETLKEYDIITVSSGIVWASEEGIDFEYLFGIGTFGEEVIRKERRGFKSKVARYAVSF